MECPFCHATLLGTPDVCYKCGRSISNLNRGIEENKIRMRQKAEINRLNEKMDQLKSSGVIDHLKALGYDEYYEYNVLSIDDGDSGTIDVEKLTSEINNLALEGWRLITAFTNEIGKNNTKVGIGGVSSGVNSTVEQNILIFERKIKIK